MKHKNVFPLVMFVVLLFALHTAAFGQNGSQESKLANIAAQGNSVRWDVGASHGAVTLIVSAPDGRVFRKEFPAGSSPEYSLDKLGLADGAYNYELRLSPQMTAGAKKALKEARGKDDDSEAVRTSRKRAAAPSLVESGTFSVINGSVIVAGAMEETDSPPAAKSSAIRTTRQRISAIPLSSSLAKYRLHHPMALFDEVIPDDLIVQGSACVGLDCVSGEVFNFDTIRLKENNTRIGFTDTSVAPFPLRDWRLRANSSASGGAAAFFIDDMGNSSTGTETVSSTPLTLTSGAPTNAIFVASTGRVGLRTGTPVLDLHITTSDTPAHRLEQTNAGGFTAQTWDIAGNEANFFVRDVTSGSRLPFRIRPGAPTSSIDISADGDVGVGTASPLTKLHATGKLIAEGSGSGNTAFADFGKLNTPGSGEVTLSLGRSGVTNGVAVIQAAKEGTGANDLSIQPSGGNVGIGTTSPAHLLSVNGTAGKPGGGSWDVFSDERLKTIRGRFNTGLSAVMQLQPVFFQYTRNNALGLKSDKQYVGFGAQAVQKVVPEAVTTNENGYLQVNNDPIIWTMLNAIKEQQQQIEQLKEEVRQLRAATSTPRK